MKSHSLIMTSVRSTISVVLSIAMVMDNGMIRPRSDGCALARPRLVSDWEIPVN